MLVIHKKTKEFHKIINSYVKNSTSGEEGKMMVVYTDGTDTLVKEKKEFMEEYELIKKKG